MRFSVSILSVFLLNMFAFGQTKKITVAADGSGNFSTVQAAFNSIPLNNKKPITVLVKNGLYKEKLHLDSSKNFVTLMGEDKFKTIISFDDHTGKTAPDGKMINTQTSETFLIKADHFSAENICFENNAGFNAGQAVAVQAAGDKLVFKNCRFLGNQDVLFTPLTQCRQYYEHCYIEGTTDFIFGAATVWFQSCHIHSKKNSHVTAASTPQEKQFGFVINDCVLTGDSSLSSVSLGRPWRPFSAVAYIHCYIGQHIKQEGWSNWNSKEISTTARYGEYKNYGPGAGVKNRISWSSQITEEQIKQFTIANIFKDWNPLIPVMKAQK